jgi:hypothetical protein
VYRRIIVSDSRGHPRSTCATPFLFAFCARVDYSSASCDVSRAGDPPQVPLARALFCAAHNSPPLVAGFFMRGRMGGMAFHQFAMAFASIVSLIMGATTLYATLAGVPVIFGGRGKKGFPISGEAKLAFSIFFFAVAVAVVFANTVVAFVAFAVMLLSFLVGNYIVFLDKEYWAKSQRQESQLNEMGRKDG